MPVDPTDPETFEDEYEQYEEEPEGTTDLEAPLEDAAEQKAELLRHREAPMTGRELTEADPADAWEQELEVELNEDEYR